MNRKMYTEDELAEYMCIAAKSSVDGYRTGLKKGFRQTAAVTSIAMLGCIYVYKKLKVKCTDKHENQ